MNENNQNSNPSEPAPKPTTLRMPVTRLAATPVPQAGKPAERFVPPEEPTLEPWEETEAVDGELRTPNKPPARMNSAAQLRRPAATPPVGRPLPAARSPYPAEPRANLASEVRPNLPTQVRTNPPAPNRPNLPVEIRANLTAEPRTNLSAETRPQVLPRMELKPILPADPARSGVNVIPVKPRVSIPTTRFGSLVSRELPPKPEPASQAAPLRPAIPESSVSKAAISTAEPHIPLAEKEVMPELTSLMAQLSNLPAQTAILGVCDDRLPVLLDLTDPAPGALLVASDDETLRLRLLRTLLQTAAALNSPRSVQFLVLSSHPDEWRAWMDELDISRHCLGVDSLLEGNPDRWLLKLAGWADQRRTGSSGPAVILVVDDLTAVPQMEYDARVNFDWLVKEGPGVCIWPVGAMAVEEAPELVRWVRLFKTRILGPAVDPALYRQLAALDEQEGTALVDDMQFAVRIHENWLKFRIPVLPGDAN